MAAKRNLPSWMSGTNVSAKVKKDSSNEVEKDFYRLPNLEFNGTIIYSYNRSECNFICEDIIKEARRKDLILGFDIEWKVNFYERVYRKTSVLQLCPSSENCYIFHLTHMDGFPSELRNLLQDPNILKVGVGIKGDMDRLKVDFGVDASRVVDLAALANQKIGNFEKWSLNGLLMNQLHLQLSKCQSVRCGDWEKIPLTNVQLEYAALDAYAGLLIYKKLNDMS